MLPTTLLFALAALVSPVLNDTADELPDDVRFALEAGGTASIRANVRFLSNDLLEGRSPGTRGGELAARYLATRMETLGLEPAGTDGGWFQKVPLVGMQTDFGASAAEMSIGDRVFPLTWLDEFVGSDLTLAPSSAVDAEMVYVGYGIHAPEQGWNDYDGIDVRGKVVLACVNDPPSDDPSFFGGPGLTYAGRWTYKYEEAARRGAVGCVLIHRDSMAGYGWTVVRNSWGREKPYVDERGADGHRLSLASWISESRITEILKEAGHDVAAMIDAAGRRGFEATPLGVRIKATLRSNVRTLDTSNVVGLLRGTTRADEYVVYSSHFDHLGKTSEMQGDFVYNGSVDNASGCGAVLEVARMFSRLRTRPERSILFLFVTAEEGGLRGSQYWCMNPTVPIEAVAANINLDSTVVNGEPLDYEPLGYDRSTLQAPMERVARLFDVRLLPDSRPEQGIFYRSDHFSFAKAGIPAVYLKHGNRFADKSEGWGSAEKESYRKERYHRVTDEFDPRWDFVGTLKTARIAFALGAIVAADPKMPAYRQDDEFYRAR